MTTLKTRDFRANRILPDLAETHHRDHLDRYSFASGYATGRRVLDIGCAFGYGTAMLAPAATVVTGIDMNDDALAYAREHYGELANFLQMDACALRFGNGAFDLVTCFEVIEHVPEPARLVNEIGRVLAHTGVAIISTPIQAPSGTVSDPTHLREYTPEEFQVVLRDGGFESVDLVGQHLAPGVWQAHEFSAWLSRLDKLGIRKFIPARAKASIFSLLFGARYGRALKKTATTSMTADLRGAAVQMAICRR